MKIIIYILILSLPLWIYGSSLSKHTEIPRDQQNLIKEYTIPKNHPLKQVLDTIFVSGEVCRSDESLIEHQFSIMSIQPSSHVRIVEHPALPGYLFKLYPHSEWRMKKDKPGWYWLLNRCIGAELISNFISSQNIKNFMVPKKYLYILPVDPDQPVSQQQPVVLIEDKISLSTEKDCAKAWHRAEKPVVKELFLILKQGYGSVSLVQNIPLSTTGKFAFIDTEYPKRRHDMTKVLPYLSDEMKKYWRKLTEEE